MRVYVGTYGKYNNGSIEGAWLDVEDYSGKDEFLEACQELHGEGEHEFMFQDHEGIPEKLISESFIDSLLWDEFLGLTPDMQEVVSLYWSENDESTDIDSITEAYQGEFDDTEDYAVQFVADTQDLGALGWLANHIDYASIARDMELGGDIETVDNGGKVLIFNRV